MFERGENLIQYLTEKQNLDRIQAIQISYDIQAGSYVENYYRNGVKKRAYCEKLAKLINTLEPCESILIAGVGEAITLCCTVPHLRYRPRYIGGFDISWSRLRYGSQFCEQQGIGGVDLFVANMLNIPLPDNSCDLVLTNHSLEPNGGSEIEAITELSRVARKYLLMNEPSFEFGSQEVRDRIDKHGYVKALAEHATSLGLRVIRNELFGMSISEANPTATTLVELEHDKDVSNALRFRCPISGCPLLPQGDSFWGIGGYAYPRIGGIPCLLPENAVLAASVLCMDE